MNMILGLIIATDLSGGFFQGNILCSPDASAGTLLASIGVYILGVQGGLIAALLVFIGNRLCADNGYAGVVGSLTMTAIVRLCRRCRILDNDSDCSCIFIHRHNS